MSDLTYKKDCVIKDCPHDNVQHVRLCARHWAKVNTRDMANPAATFAWIRLVPYSPNSISPSDLSDAIAFVNRYVDDPSTPLPESIDDLLGAPLPRTPRAKVVDPNDVSDLM